MFAASRAPSAPNRSTARSVALRIHPHLPILMLSTGVIAQQLVDTQIAPIPNCSPWFCGVARHGAHIVPFFDLALWAGVERPSQRGTVMVTVNSGDHSVGVLASESPLILAPGQVVAAWSGKSAFARETAIAGTALFFDPRAWLAEIASSITAESG
jgi:hypothetical protein